MKLPESCKVPMINMRASGVGMGLAGAWTGRTLERGGAASKGKTQLTGTFSGPKYEAITGFEALRFHCSQVWRPGQRQWRQCVKIPFERHGKHTMAGHCVHRRSTILGAKHFI